MPTYQPNIPTGSVPLNEDYLNLQGNFQQLNIAYGVDHVAFSDTSGIPPGGQSGLHKVIHLQANSTIAGNPPNNFPITPPSAVGLTGEIFCTQSNDGVNSDELLWYQSGGGRLMQLTRNFVPVSANNGYTFIPGGLIVQWGRKTGLSGAWPTTEQTLTFSSSNISFANNCFAVWTTFIGPTSSSTGDITINSVSSTNFKWQFSGSSGASFGGFYWLAIGN